MIIPEDKKRIATIISSRKSASGEKLGAAPMAPQVVKEEDGSIDGLHVASRDMLAAIHEKDPAKLMNALMNWQDIHASRINKSEEE